MGLISEILQKVDAVTLNYTAHSYQAIVSAHSTELHLMLVLYIALYGLAVLQGVIPATTRELAKHILKAFIIFEVATNWGMFTTFFYNGFTSGPDKITGALTGGVKASDQLGHVFDVGIDCAARVMSKGGTLTPGIGLIGLLIAISTILMTGYALFLIILAKLGIAILLSLAPIFIGLALFRSTKGLFHSWVNYLVNFAMISVITYALLALILVIMQEAVLKIEQAGEFVGMYQALPYIFIGVISSLLFMQVNRIASSLGGGVALSTMDAISRYVNSPAKSLAKSAVRSALRGDSHRGGEFSNRDNTQTSSKLQASKSPQLTPATSVKMESSKSESLKNEPHLSSSSFSNNSNTSSSEKEFSSRLSSKEYKSDSQSRFQRPQSSRFDSHRNPSPTPVAALAAPQVAPTTNQISQPASDPKHSSKTKAIEKKAEKK